MGLIATVFLALSPTILSAQAHSAITVTVHAPKEEAQAKVTQAMIAEGLSIADATSGGLIVGTGTENHDTEDVRYTAVILPADSSGSEVTLSAVATARASFAGTKIERRVAEGW